VISVRGRLAGVLATAALAAAGCGGDDEDSGSGSEPAASETIPLADYVARADRICAGERGRLRAELRPLGERIGADGKTTEAELMELNKAAAEGARPLVEELRDLPEPETKQAEVREYEAAVTKTLDLLDASVAAFERGDREEAAEKIEENRASVAEIERSAGAVGFKECGTEFSS
jgi:hypothetical protein